jgi:hypothetical protein
MLQNYIQLLYYISYLWQQLVFDLLISGNEQEQARKSKDYIKRL